MPGRCRERGRRFILSIQVNTKIKIAAPAEAVFEALVDPEKIGHYWFSSGSGRWDQGKTVTLRYAEYNATVDIQVREVQVNKKIVFQWSGPGEQVVTIALKALDDASTTIAVTQEGWKDDEESLISKLLDNKEGWVYMLTCLKAYLEFGVNQLRAGLVR
jgi:uncharacterized protein YndB with AHSA1/START domain